MTASASFKQISGIDWLHKRDSLPSDVPSSEFAIDLDWIRRCQVACGRGRLCAWFPGADDREVEEDVAGLDSYERLLTVLMTEETELDKEDGEEPEDDGAGACNPAPVIVAKGFDRHQLSGDQRYRSFAATNYPH